MPWVPSRGFRVLGCEASLAFIVSELVSVKPHLQRLCRFRVSDKTLRALGKRPIKPILWVYTLQPL